MTRGGKKRHDRPSNSYNEQRNMAEFAEEAATLRPRHATEYPPSLNNISKHTNN